MDSLVVINHVPKTAGSCFRQSIMKANVPNNKVYRYKKLSNFIFDMLKNDYTVVVGHVPYGLHHFTLKTVKYIIFLREPIDRAISHYYFLKSPNATLYGKPRLFDFANSVSLREFYRDRRLHDLQTRFAVGLIGDKIYPIISSYPLLKKILLNQAINNLKNHYFGICVKEYYEESVAILQKKLDWEKNKYVRPQDLRKTINRPKVADLDDETLEILRQANSLDLQLYDFALKHLVNFSR